MKIRHIIPPSIQVLFLLGLVIFNGPSMLAQSPGIEDTAVLKVGDKAPPLSIIAWMNGKPVSAFATGKIYVIEFGFASCIPCQASIPHLAEIVRKYRNEVTVVGVHIWENNKEDPEDLHYIQRVKNYVASRKPLINYVIAVDGPSQRTADNWMKAAGQYGAPRSFVVDKLGKIAWIGFPNELDPVLEKLVHNDFNAIIEKQKQDKAKSQIDSALTMAAVYKNQGNLKKSISILDSLIAKYPNKWDYLYYMKFLTLRGADDDRADSLVRWMLNSHIEAFRKNYFHLAQDVLFLSSHDYNLAIELADQALQFSKGSPAVCAFIYEVKARAYFFKGEIIHMVATLNTAIDIIEANFDRGSKDERELKAYFANELLLLLLCNFPGGYLPLNS